MEVPREGGLALSSGWYVRESGLGLSSFAGKPALLLSSPWKRTLIVVLRGLPAPSEWVRLSSTSRRRSPISPSAETWLSVARLRSSTRGPTLAVVDRLEMVTDGLGALSAAFVEAPLAKRCLAASKASFALLLADALVGDVFSALVNRRIVAPCCG